MKNIHLFLIILGFASLGISACNMFCENGNGTIGEGRRNLEEFTKIDIEGIGKVVLNKDSDFYVKVIADENLLPFIKTEVKRGQLLLGTTKCIDRISKLEFHVGSIGLEAIEMSGSGEMESRYKIIADEFDIEVSGAGKLRLHLEVEQLKTEISGSGQVELSGTCVEQNIEMSGAGKLKAMKLVSARADVELSGSGLCEINVSQSLEAQVSGSGDIVYKGSPQKVNTDVSGSGKIRTK